MNTPTLKLRRYLRHGTLPQLAAFESVLRLGSVTRAADALCLAQPTVSGQLRKLSDSMGLPLFLPQGRHLAPTPAALALQQAVDEVFAALERVDSVLAGLRQQALHGTASCTQGCAADCSADCPG